MYTAILVDEAIEQLNNLDKASRNKIIKAMRIFESEGENAKNSRILSDGLFEIKADNVRAYFKYFGDKIIIVGLIVLKKSQKAPKRFIEQAVRNIRKAEPELNKE